MSSSPLFSYTDQELQAKIALLRYRADKSSSIRRNKLKEEVLRRKEAKAKRREEKRKKAAIEALVREKVEKEKDKMMVDFKSLKARCDAMEASLYQEGREKRKTKRLFELATAKTFTDVASCLEKLKMEPDLGVGRAEIVQAALSAKTTLGDAWPASLFGETLEALKAYTLE